MLANRSFDILCGNIIITYVVNGMRKLTVAPVNSAPILSQTTLMHGLSANQPATMRPAHKSFCKLDVNCGNSK